MILYSRHDQDSTRKLIVLMYTFSKVAEYKNQHKNTIDFLLINNKLAEKEVRTIIQFTSA
jgi:hypothetical protein